LIDCDSEVAGRYRTNYPEQVDIFEHFEQTCCLLLEDIAPSTFICPVSKAVEVKRVAASMTTSIEVMLHTCNEVVELGVQVCDQRIVHRER
jgi:hypothetical protein